MKYQNKFISSKFVCFDEKQKVEGKPHVLPLTTEEERLYAVPSIHPTIREGRAILRFGVPVVSHFITWVMFITVDALLYYFVEIVTTKLSELEPLPVPLIISIKVSMFVSVSDPLTCFCFYSIYLSHSLNICPLSS